MIRFGAVELAVADPEAYAAFLERVLGVRRAGAGDARVVTIGASRLVLRAGPAAVQHLALTVRTGAFDAAVAALTAHVPLLERDGHTVFEGPPSWDSRSVYLGGPDGHVLELIERRRLAAGPGGVLTGISEVGVAVPDVEIAVTRLRRERDLTPLGPAGPDFAAVGDDEGLLILVRAGRPWLPTADRLAEPSDVVVRLDGPAGTTAVGGCRLVSPARAAG